MTFRSLIVRTLPARAQTCSASTRTFVVSALALLAAAPGCTDECVDDGWEWEQDQQCVANSTQSSNSNTNTNTNTDSNTNTNTNTEGPSGSDSEAGTVTSATATDPTATAGADDDVLVCCDDDGDGAVDELTCMEYPADDVPDELPGCANTVPFPPDGGGTDSNSDSNTNSGTESDSGESDGSDSDTDTGGPNPNPGEPVFDCDDSDPNTFPGAAPKDDPEACMTDADGDDYGDDYGGEDDEPGPGVVPGTDCDDNDPDAAPGAAPKDDPEACMLDGDGDDYGSTNPDNPDVDPGTDCYDENMYWNPDAVSLISGPAFSGEVKQIDPSNGSVSNLVDVGFELWAIKSMVANPIEDMHGTVYAVSENSIFSLNYCGGGAPTEIATIPYKLCGIALNREADTMYGVDPSEDVVVTIDTGSWSVTNVQELGIDDELLQLLDCGLALDCAQDRLMLSHQFDTTIWEIDPVTGVVTSIVDNAGNQANGVAYDAAHDAVLGCSGSSFTRTQLDGSGGMSLPNLSETLDDLTYGPSCG